MLLFDPRPILEDRLGLLGNAFGVLLNALCLGETAPVANQKKGKKNCGMHTKLPLPLQPEWLPALPHVVAGVVALQKFQLHDGRKDFRSICGR